MKNGIKFVAEFAIFTLWCAAYVYPVYKGAELLMDPYFKATSKLVVPVLAKIEKW